MFFNSAFEKIHLKKKEKKCKCLLNEFVENTHKSNIKAFVECQKHGEQYSHCCYDHLVLCCDKCKEEYHTACGVKISNDDKPKAAVGKLYQTYMNLEQFHSQLALEADGMMTDDICYETEKAGRAPPKSQIDKPEEMKICAMFKVDCLNLIRHFRSDPCDEDRLILLQYATLLYRRINKHLPKVVLTHDNCTQANTCLCGRNVEETPTKREHRVEILDTAVTKLTTKLVETLKRKLGKRDIGIAYAGPLSRRKEVSQSIPLLVICSWDTRLDVDVKAALDRVQSYGLDRVCLLILQTKEDQNHILHTISIEGYTDKVGCYFHLEKLDDLPTAKLDEILSFLVKPPETYV